MCTLQDKDAKKSKYCKLETYEILWRRLLSSFYEPEDIKAEKIEFPNSGMKIKRCSENNTSPIVSKVCVHT